MKKNKTNIASNELKPESIEFLGLTKQPFASEILTGDSYFNFQAIDKISESLSHQAQFSDLLLIIEGPQGSGKTALFRQFIQSEVANIKILSMQAETTDTLTQLQQKMSMHLQDLGDANHLEDNLKSLQTFDQIPLVVMDSSHVLSDTTLQELIRYQQQLKQDHEVTLKLLFFANTGMAETIQKITDIAASQIYVQNIPELSPKQVENFISHKLRIAGYAGEALLTESHIQSILKKGPGTPAHVMLSAASIIDSIVEQKLNPPLPLWKKILIALISLTVVGGGLAAYFLLQPGTTDTESTTVNKPVIEKPIIKQDAIEPVKETQPTEESVEPEDTLSTLNESDLLEPSTPGTQEASDPESTSEKNTVTDINNLATPGVNSKGKSLPETIEDQAVKNIMPADTPSIAKTELPAPAKPATIEPPTPAVRPAIPAKKPTVKSRLHPDLKKLSALGIKDAKWLKQQPSSNWTMQLIGAREPVTLLKFAKRHKLGSSSAWYKTWLKGKPYYVLVHGTYASRDIARNSINQLPANLRSLKPWVKSMKSVQKAAKN